MTILSHFINERLYAIAKKIGNKFSNLNKVVSHPAFYLASPASVISVVEFNPVSPSLAGFQSKYFFRLATLKLQPVKFKPC
jgi:hypothetical protein